MGGGAGALVAPATGDFSSSRADPRIRLRAASGQSIPLCWTTRRSREKGPRAVAMPVGAGVQERSQPCSPGTCGSPQTEQRERACPPPTALRRVPASSADCVSSLTRGGLVARLRGSGHPPVGVWSPARGGLVARPKARLYHAGLAPRHARGRRLCRCVSSSLISDLGFSSGGTARLRCG